MIKTFLALLLLLALTPTPSLATPLAADMSMYRINVDANFSGAKLFLFGARNDPGDIIVIIRGPVKDYILRKKEKIAGVWVNSSRIKLFGVPAFYAVSTSKPLSDIVQNGLFQQLGIGMQTLFPTFSDPQISAVYRQYIDAFLDQQNKKNFSEDPKAVQFMGETLFKTVVDFPDNIPPGNYTAEIYLVSDGQLVGQQTLPLAVVKSGLDAWVYNYAHDWPAFYGLFAVALAMTAGWLAGRIFENLERAS